jgi:hypothetical protein
MKRALLLLANLALLLALVDSTHAKVLFENLNNSN